MSAAPVMVTFARPEESSAFRRRLADPRRETWGGLPATRGGAGGHEVVVIHTGIGPAAASRAVESALQSGLPRMVISAGFAGALDPALNVGDTLVADSSVRAIISRPDPIETVAEKAAAFRETGARLVDMETASIAAICERASIRLVSARAVSDSANEPLPVPFGVWFNVERQRPRPLALVSYLALRPARAIAFARFVWRLPRVAASLARAVEGALA
jgi:adenosylhomocysteine nucleosidase